MARPCTHCWHDPLAFTPVSLDGVAAGAVADEQCCWCGRTRRISYDTSGKTGDHGLFRCDGVGAVIRRHFQYSQERERRKSRGFLHRLAARLVGA